MYNSEFILNQDSLNIIGSKLGEIIKKREVNKIAFKCIGNQDTKNYSAKLELLEFDIKHIDTNYIIYNENKNYIIAVVCDRLYLDDNVTFRFFCPCSILDLTSIDTSRTRSMKSLFSEYKCDELDLSSFDTSNVENMSGMFCSCKAKKITISKLFNTSKVKDMSFMFCSSRVKSFDTSLFDTSNVENMSDMFTYCHMNNIDVSNFVTSKVKNMNSIFANLELENFDASNINILNTEDVSKMFDYSKINNLKIFKFDSKQLKHILEIFEHFTGNIITDDSEVRDLVRIFKIGI